MASVATAQEGQETHQGKQCCLCGRGDGYMIRFERWSEKERQYVLRHMSEPPLSNSVTCKRDRLEAKRYCDTPDHVPKWKKNTTAPTPSPTQAPRTCIHPQCTATSEHDKIIQTSASRDRIKEYLQLPTTPEGPCGMCRRHYHEFYSHLHCPSVCSSCGARPKTGTRFSRHTPNAQLISKHLSETLGTTVTITPLDYICYRCYTAHINIMKDLNSSDEALKKDIQTWKVIYRDTTTDRLTKSILKAVLVVSDHLLQQMAVLLPQISQVFLEAYGGPLSGADLNLEVGDSTVKFSSQWLLHQLIIYLHAYMSYKCEHKKFGTILFRKGGNLLASLSWALGSTSLSNPTQPTTSMPFTGHDKIIQEAGDIINDLLHDEIRKSSERDPSSLNITELFQKVHPLLVTFIKLATRSVRERHHAHLEPESVAAKHTKNIRQYFIISLLLQCINPNHCSMLHTILSDIVEMCGGSRLLIKVLNRLGCVSSADTHDRFVTERAEEKRKMQIWDELSPHVFTIASVDNFDMLQSHAAVYCGNQQRSYHGTTVQLVQPNHHSAQLRVSASNTNCSSGACPDTFPLPTPVCSVMTPNTLPSDSSHMDQCPSPVSSVTYLVNNTDTSMPSQSLTSTPMESVSFPGSLQANTVSPEMERCLSVSTLSPSGNPTTDTSIFSHSCIPNTTTSTTTKGDVLTDDPSNLQPVSTDTPTPRSILIGRSRGRHSPASSPHKLGKRGPKRRRTVSIRKLPVFNELRQRQQAQQRVSSLSLASFKESPRDKQALTDLMTKLHAYNIERYVAEHHMILSDVRSFLNDAQSGDDLLPSQVYYMELVDENPDTEETMMLVAEDLLDKFGTHSCDSWVVLVGDGKTYQHLMQIKQHYGASLDRLLIFPGDWHILKNYQETLMKVYYSAGLRDIAKESGYHGRTLSSLEFCGNFKRTHNFLLQVWEALYREMIRAFTTHNVSSLPIETVQCILSAAAAESTPPNTTMKRIIELLEDSESLSAFNQFIEEQSNTDDTWKFWSQFIFKDCFAYIALYLAIRGSSWQLRVASLKLMAPLFAAFDRDLYQRIIPYHLADIQRYPQHILNSLQAGGFTVSLGGRRWHSVAIDEAHEMCINKDLKLATVRPTPSYLQKTSLFFNYRISAYKKFLQQLFPDRKNQPQSDNLNSITDNTTSASKKEENIKHLCTCICKASLLSPQTNNRGLINCFTGQRATPEQANDMLHFRKIGTESFHQFITHRILMQASTSEAPVRRKKLLTMNRPKTTKHRLSQKEKESKLVAKCLRRRLAWCNRTNLAFDQSHEQYSIYPRALADEYGNPHKAPKCTWTDKIASRYRSATPPVVTPSLPHGWIPQTVLIDAMFLINTTPLRRNKNITDYSHLLFSRFALHHYKSGVKDVHFLFDMPNQQEFNPKIFEQGRRDVNTTVTGTTKTHQHVEFTPSTPIPSGWRQYIQCRQCKRSITKAIGLAYLQTGGQLLRHGQKLLVAGCFSGDGEECVWTIYPGTGVVPEPSPEYRSNAEEADFRIWRHATQSISSQILIYSPDTDVYNIGLPLVGKTDKEYIIQLNVPHAHEQKFLHLNNFVKALSSDPDLASLNRDKLANTFQTLFVCTGCDYISYFKSLGKATFLNIFYQHSEFITGEQMPGNLHEVQSSSHSFLAFVRLVGTAYFKKHIAAFTSLYSYSTPIQLFNSYSSTESHEEIHQKWLQDIRKVTAERITTEEERVPSYTSLWRHWLRTCWSVQLWQSSPEEDMYSTLPSPESYGWLHNSDGTYSIDWEDPKVQEEIQGTVDFLIKGCTCRKGCSSNRCRCRKKGNHCGPGCECQGCMNIPLQQPAASSTNTSDSEDSSDVWNSSGSEETDEDVETIEAEVVTMEELIFDQVDIV